MDSRSSILPDLKLKLFPVIMTTTGGLRTLLYSLVIGQKKKRFEGGFAAHLQKLIALDASVDDFRACLIELLAADPHLLESLQ